MYYDLINIGIAWGFPPNVAIWRENSKINWEMLKNKNNVLPHLFLPATHAYTLAYLGT